MDNTLGKKMFKGAKTGAAIGLLGGGLYGRLKAQVEIEKLPVDKVELGGYDKPVYETQTIKDLQVFTSGKKPGGTEGAANYTRKIEVPVRNADGSLKMEHVPSQIVEGHGEAVLESVTHDIKEPTIHKKARLIGDNNGHGSSYNEFTPVTYETVGTWQEPAVRFEHGVNVGLYMLGYAAGGAVVGGVGGALVAAAVDLVKGDESPEKGA